MNDFNITKGNYGRYVFSKEQGDYIEDMYLNQNMSTVKLGKLFNVNNKIIARELESRGITRTGIGRRKYFFNENYFDRIDTHNKAYVFGLLCADGCNYPQKRTVSISLQEGDREILEKLRKEIGLQKELEYINYTNKHDFGYTYKNQYRLLIFSKHICESLNQLGMIPNKSMKLQYPKISEEFNNSFILGYFDGNGSTVKRYGKCVNYSINFTSTECFCNSLKDIFKRTLGISNIRIVDQSCHNGITKSLCVSRKYESKKLLDWMYKDSTIHMNRKYNNYRDVFY